MKKSWSFIVAALFAVALVFIGCDSSGGSDDDDDNDVVFLDRNLQGTINGKPFTFVSGMAEKNDDDGTYALSFYSVAPEGRNPWDLFAYTGTYLAVFAEVPARVGRTDLFWDLETGERETVTLYDYVNTPAHVGAVEITSISAAAGMVSGRIAASDGEGNEVNGNFTVKIAP